MNMLRRKLNLRSIQSALTQRVRGAQLVVWFVMACYFTGPAAAEYGHVCRYCSQDSLAAFAADLDTSTENVRHYAPEREVDIRHVKIDITPDFDRRAVSGHVTLRFAPIAKPIDSLTLDGIDLRVLAVRSSHAVRDWSADRKNITIVFDPPLPAGKEASVDIEYSAEPLAGLYFCTPEMGFPKGDTHCWTQGEPHEARHWFPCFDYPNERSSSELVCTVPGHMTVVSNGRLLSENVSPEGKFRTFHWLQEKSHPSYLICFVAGNLEKIETRYDTVPLGFYTQPSRAAHAGSGLRDTADILEFFETEIGVKFPWEKYDQCTVADFMWGGMENTTITTLTQRTLFEHSADDIRAMATRRLNAHELAHQWFGNFVTCKDWSHIWLNEGFATYYTHLYEGQRFGREALLYGLYQDATKSIFSSDNVHDVRPMVYREYRHPIEQFDFRNYPKASWVLHMLRCQMGEKLFRTVVRTYLERHALSSVETEQLRGIFEELSGNPLDQFFDQWVYHGGHPQLKVEYQWIAEEQLARVTVEQKQASSDDVLLFQFPTTLRFVVDGEAINRPIEVHSRKQDFYVRLPAEPKIVRFDPDYTVLSDVEFDKSTTLLRADLANENDLVGRLLACEGLSKRPTTSAIEALRHALRHDAFYGVRRAAATALRTIGTRESCAALAQGISDEDARVRQTVVEELGRCYGKETQNTLRRVITDEEVPTVAATSIVALARCNPDEAGGAIRDALASHSFNNERAAAAFLAIGELNDPKWATELIKTLGARDADIEARDLAVGFATLARISKREKARGAAFRFLAKYVNHPRESLRIAAMRALGKLHDRRAVSLLQPLDTRHTNQRIQSAAKHALKALEEEADVVPGEVAELRRELRELREAQIELKKSIEELNAKSKSLEL